MKDQEPSVREITEEASPSTSCAPERRVFASHETSRVGGDDPVRSRDRDCPKLITHDYGQVKRVLAAAANQETRLISIVQVEVV